MLPDPIDYALERQALSLFQRAEYQEASKLLLRLLASSDNHEWQQKLAYCYLQSAMGFAEKGLYQDAVLQWDNHRRYTQNSDSTYPNYIIWQILSQNKANIQVSLKQLTAEQLDKQYPALAAVLGRLILASHVEWEAYLPQDAVFLVHLTCVRAAFKAYQDQGQTFKDALQALPYRSAFRDLRSVLNAVELSNKAGQREQAVAQLAKIPVYSAYFPVARLLLAYTANGSELAQQLLKLNYQQRRLIVDIKGFNHTQMEFIEHFCRQQSNLSDKVQFNLALQYQSLLGNEFTQQFCQSLLAVYPAGRKDFNQQFIESSDFEENRVNALSCEQDNNLHDAVYYWNLCIHILKNEPTDQDLKIALILRHMAEFEAEGEARTELLIASLEADVKDRDCYLQIINYYSQQANSGNTYLSWLNTTLTQFPDDIEVLTFAVKVAISNNCNEKAGQYATQILSSDPFNRYAKLTLFAIHMAQAQSLMRAENYVMVDQEMCKAEKLSLDNSYTLQIQIIRALLCFAMQDKALGLQQVRVTLEAIHSDPVNLYFHAANAALLCGLPVTTILHALPEANEYLLTEQALVALTGQLNQHADNNDDLNVLLPALDYVMSPVQQSISEQSYTEQTLLNFCKMLDKIKHFELLYHSAKIAQRYWQTPIWVYYRVYAHHKGVVVDYSYLDVQRLQKAKTRAKKDKDLSTALLLTQLLDAYFAEHPQRNLGLLEGLFGFDTHNQNANDDTLDKLFGHLADGVLIELNRSAETMTQTMTAENIITAVMPQVDNNEAMLLAVMHTPDILSALMLLQAATELHIDIDVDIEDVLELFGIAENIH